MKNLKELIEKYPNDTELGQKIRENYRKDSDLWIKEILNLEPNDAILGKKIRNLYLNHENNK